MLVEDRIAAARRIEEGRAEIAIGQQHRDRRGEHRQRQQQQEGGDQHRPGEQRHLVQRHARRAHVEDGGDEVDRAEDRRGAGKVERQDRHVDRRPRLAIGGERRIDRPAGAGAAGEGGAEQQREGRHDQPEADVVHAREGHVRRADHDRHEPVAEAADHRRHDHEEHHDQAVRGDQHVPEVQRRRRRCGRTTPRRYWMPGSASSARIRPEIAPPMIPAMIAKIR